MKKIIILWALVGALSLRADAAPKPVLELNVDLMELLQPYAASNEFAMAMAAMGISKAAVGIYVDEGRIIPIAKLDTTMPQLVALFLSDTNKTGLTVISPTEFGWGSDEKSDLILQLFKVNEPRVRVEGNSILLSDASEIARAAKLDAAFMKSDLAKGVIQLAPLMEPLLATARAFVETQEGMGKAIIGGMVDSVEAGLKGLKTPPVISFHMTADGANHRAMTLTLEFPAASMAKETQAFFENASEAWKDPSATDQQIGISALADSAYFLRMDCEGAKLRLHYSWPVADDRMMLERLGKPLSSCLTGFMKATTYPELPEKTIEAPKFEGLKEFDRIAFEQDVRSALYFSHNWSSRIDLELDWFDPTAADFMTVTVSNVMVVATNGTEMVDVGKRAQFWSDNTRKNARVSLPTLKERPAADHASFTLHFEYPREVEILSLSPANSVHETGDGGVCLIALSNSVVQLRAKGVSLRDAKIYARNAAGEYLRGKGASWSESRYRGTFSGRPASVELAFTKGSESLSFDFSEVPVSKENKVTMPKNPTNSVPARYTLEPVKEFISPDLAVIEASTVSYVTNGGWQKNECRLEFPMFENVKVDNTGWRSYLTGVEEFVSQGQYGGWSGSGGMYYWTLNHTNALKTATAIVGEMEIRVRDGVGSYSVTLSTNATSLIEGTELPTAAAEENVVWIAMDQEGELLEIQAFDAAGRRLKKDHRTSYSQSRRGYFFWGTPARVEIIHSKNKSEVNIPFAIELRAGGLDTVAGARKKAAAFDALNRELSEVRNSIRNYGNLLAANYYKVNRKGEPEEQVSLNIAQADPEGTEVFGYELHPYKGYYLKLIPSDHNANREQRIQSHKWAGGEFDAPVYRGLLLANPVDPKEPTILYINQNDAFVKYADCSDLEVITTDERQLVKDGWIKIR